MPPYFGCEGGPGSGGTKEIKIFKEDVLNWFVRRQLYQYRPHEAGEEE